MVVGLDGGVASDRSPDAAARIAWARRGMRATARLAEQLADSAAREPEARGSRSGAEPGTESVLGSARRPPRIAVSLVLEPKTAALTLALADAGCEVALFSAVSETDPEVAAALAADGRVAVFAPTGAVSRDAAARLDAEHAAAILDWAPEYLIDDGSHLIRLAHTERPSALEHLRAAAEETTSGVRPLHEMAAEGSLRVPVIAVNDARTKTDFDNLVGTGQSCVLAIADLLDGADSAGGDRRHDGYRGVAGTRWAVIGYGPVGVGTARFAAALGARVTVVERDPVRALSALHDGFEARRAEEALPAADVVVSATGVWHTLDADGFALLRPGTAVAVAGGIDDELALDDLLADGWCPREVGDGLAEWVPPGGDRGPVVLAEGGGVNYTAAEGNPIEVMDLSFATQLAALMRLMGGDLAPGVHTLSAEDEDRVARAALEARGGSADPAPLRSRPGGAAQPWAVHRYRAAFLSSIPRTQVDG
ncbi:adenosylhomocysteinase [Leucobacter tenebrionis]|nr:adenosylhomocysteinase [Leucobacter tenebrionis]